MRATTMFIIVCLIIIGSYQLAVMGLYCTDIKLQGGEVKYSVEVLKTLSDEDLVFCLVYLGKDDIDVQQGKYIWDRLIKIYEGISNIPENDLQQLGWIARSIPVRDIANLTIGDIDTIAAFGQYHNLSHAQLQAIAEQVRDDWASKEPTDYTFYDLVALKHILCGFNRTAIDMIHPDSYKEAATVLATLHNCGREPLQALAELAINDDAFGDPSTWYSSQVKSVGCVLNGLSRDDIGRIPPEGIESLMPDIIPCLERETLRAMSSEQLRHLTPSAVASLTEEQKSALSRDQRIAVDQAYEGKLSGPPLLKSGSLKINSQYLVAVALLLMGVRYLR